MKSTWRLLRRTYWSVAKAVPAAATAADSPLPNWPDWIRSKCSDSLLQLVLHTLHEQDWKALASRRQAVKDDPVSRTTRIATRLGLIEEGSGKQPWTMFLYFELATLQTTRCMRDFAAAVSRNKTKSAQALLDALNKSAVERSPDSESPPWISVDDVKALIVELNRDLPPPQRNTTTTNTSVKRVARVSASEPPPKRTCQSVDEVEIEMGRRERFSTLTMDPDVSDLSFGVNSSSSLMRFSSLPPDSRRSSTFILNPLPTPIQRPSRHSLLPLESQPSSSFILNPSPLQSIQSSSFISNPSPLQRPSRRYSSLPPESIPSSSFITNPRSSTLSRIRVSSSSTSNQATNGPSEAYLEALQVILRKGSVSSSDSHTTNLHSIVHMSVSALLAKLNEDELGNKE